MREHLNNNPEAAPHMVVFTLAMIGMLSGLAWKVYIGEKHTWCEWLAVSFLSLAFSAAMGYLLYPNFPGEYGKLLMTSIVSGAGATVYLGVMIKVGRAGVDHFRKMLITIAEDEKEM